MNHSQQVRNFSVKFADRCAWRAVYVYRRGDNGSLGKIAHAGIAPPYDGRPPAFFGSFGRLDWRLPLPHVRYRHGAGRLGRLACRLSARFWHGMDGRYGWGREY